jgi:excinuclease ABC subunit C
MSTANRDIQQRTRFEPAAVLRHLTHRPGVYQMIDRNGVVIYVGKARDLQRRVGSYFSGRAKDAKTMAMVRLIADVQVTVTRTESEALMLEYNLIKRHKPRFNVVLRDDKSYPYIYVNTEHEFPRLAFYRGARKRIGRLFGPYPSAGSVRETLSQLQKLFQLRDCEDSYFANRSRPCLQHQIGRCTAPCVGLIAKEDYRRDVEHAMLFLQGRNEAVTESMAARMEQASAELKFERAAQYRDQLAKLKQVEAQQVIHSVGGDLDALGLSAEHGVFCVCVVSFRGGRLLGSRNYFPEAQAGAGQDEVIRAFLLQYYYGGREAPPDIIVSRSVPEADALAAMLSEQAGRRVQIRWRLRGDRARWVKMALTNARHGAELRHSASATLTRQLEALSEALEMDEVPERLECFDVSHTAGEETVAACVVFGLEGPLKSEYRRFNISGVIRGDDYGALAQALERRYARVKRGEAPMPDVLFIDGGQGQLARAMSVLTDLQLDQVRVVAVAKGPGRRAGHERLYIHGRDRALVLGPESPALHLVQQIRDEAHRFAIGAHRLRRGKRRTMSPLEAIEGLGPKRRQALLRQFGGLQAVSRAGVEELSRVRGISRQLAESIYQHFHGS